MADDLTPLVEPLDMAPEEDFVPSVDLLPKEQAYEPPGMGTPTAIMPNPASLDEPTQADIADNFNRMQEERKQEELRQYLKASDATPAGDGQAGAAESGGQPVGRYEGPIYRRLRAKLESERQSIELGLSRTHPNWAHAEAELEAVRAQEEENFRKQLAGEDAPKEALSTKIIRNVNPVEAAGGVLDAVDELFSTARALSSGMDEAAMGAGIPALVVDENGPRLTTDYEEFKGTENIGDYVPDIGDPNKPGLARSLGQFLTGYAGASKALSGVQKLQTLAKSGWKGQSYASAIKGAVGDFFTADPMEANLANVVQEFPSIANPVAEALASKEDDPEVWNRLKTAATGVGFGLATDRFVAGVRYLWKKRHTGQIVADEAAKVVELESIAEAQRSRLSELLGDPDSDSLVHIREAEPEVATGTARESAGSDAAAAGSDTASASASAGARLAGGMDLGDGIYINTARIESDEDVKTIMQQLADRFTERVKESQRGVRSHQQTIEAAREEDAWQLIQQHSKGTVYNAEQTYALRRLWSASAKQFMKQGELVASGGGPLDEIALNKMMEVHAMIQDVVLGVRTEQARAQNQWNIPAGPADEFLKGIQDLLAKNGGSKDAKLVAKGLMRLKTIGQPGAPDAYIRGMLGYREMAKRIGIRASDMANQVFYMSILSSPRTILGTNPISNFANQLWLATERVTASQLGRLLGDQQIPAGEAGALIYGNLVGMRKAFSANAAEYLAEQADIKLAAEAASKRSSELADAAKAATDPKEAKRLMRLAEKENREAIRQMSNLGKPPRTPVGRAFYEGKVSDGSLTKFDTPREGSFSAGAFGADSDKPLGAMLDLIDATMHIPQRGLQAGDVAFRSSNYFGQIAALAYRKAWREVKAGAITPEEFDQRRWDLENSPDQAMRLLADDYASEAVFAKDPPWDGQLYGAMRSLNRVGGIGKLLMTFTRVTYNANNTLLRRTPAGLAMPGFWRDVDAGGATEQLALAKVALGTGALITAASLADRALSPDTFLVGMQKGLGQGDVSTSQYQNKLRIGERANSIHMKLEGDRVASINVRRLEPPGGVMVLAANMVAIANSQEFDDNDPEVSSAFMAAGLAVTTQILGQQAMTGFSQFVAASDNPLMNAESYAEYLGRIVVPAAVRDVAYQQDPTVREVNGILEAMMASTPGLSDGLTASTDTWGFDLSRASGVGGAFDLISPVPIHVEQVHPIDREIDRLGVPITTPRPTQSFDGIDINLRKYPEAFRYYKQQAGHDLKFADDLGNPIRAVGGHYKGTGLGLRDELSAIVTGKHPFSEYYNDPKRTDKDKSNFIEEIVEAYRDAAKEKVLERYPEVMAYGQLKYMEAKRTNAISKDRKNKFFDSTQ